MKVNIADILCQRIEMGFAQPGDWIRLTSEIACNNPPRLYSVNIMSLKITPIKGKQDGV